MKIKRLMNAVVAVAMVGINIGGGVIPVLAAAGDDYDYAQMHPAAYHVPDGDDDESNDLILYKTAEYMPGYANKWEVTLRIEAPTVTATSDTVLVIDRSNSMNGTPLTNAKDAAEVLVDKLLNTESGSEINRVAVVSYGSDVTTETGFSNVYSTAYGAVDDIEIDSFNGGTFTQAAMHQAAELLNSSTATYKNIVLLSDGEPTYSYRLNNPENYLVSYSGGGANAVETNTSAPQTEYNYDRTAGNGTSLRTRFNTGCPRNENCYYNHGNSAIAEAGFFKNKGHLYTIAFVNSEIGTGATILRDMATAAGGEAHSATADELENVFNAIAGKIMDQVNSAHVHDVMGEGVVVEDAAHHGSTMIDWENIEFDYDPDLHKYVAFYSYDVEAGEHILDANSTDGYHPLNEEATLVYTDANGVEQEADFPVPRVKPFFINVKKELVGQTCTANQCIFTFKIEHPAGAKTTEYTVEAGKTHSIVEAFPIGNYTLTEIGTNAGNPVAFENYTTEYTVDGTTGNTFEITQSHGDHIDVVIKNTYETTSVSASKVWNDNDDQDGLRENYDDFWVVVKDGEGNYVAMQELTGTNKSYSFTNLPKNYNGSEIAYKVVEASGCEEDDDGVITCEKEFNGNNGEVSIDNDYTMEVGANNVITNKHTPATVKIIVNKDWNDDNNRDGLRTDTKQVEFCVTGKVGSEVVYEKTCKQASSLIAEIEIEFAGLPKYYDGGQVIKYEVEESEFLGYNPTGLPEEAFAVEDEEDVDVTNVHTPEKISVLIQKVWDDGDNNDNSRPEQITGTLTGGDNDVPVTIKQSDKVEGKCDEWCIELTGLYKNKQGQAIKYGLSEDEITGYTTKITGDAENGFTITNTYDQFATVTVSVDKSWNDDNNRDGLRDDNSTVTFCVTGYAGDYVSTPVCKTVLTGVGLKTDVVTFENLLKYHDGVELSYEVTEVNTLDGYTSDLVAGEYVVITDDEGTQEVINTHEPEKIAILIEKIWDDENDKDELRPDQISVTLAGGDEDLAITIEESDSVEGKCEAWCVEVPNLYKNANGSAIEYSVTEEEIEGYSAEISGDAENGFTITNKHESEPEPDPCADGEGCGGDVIPIVPPITPDTGGLTLNRTEGVQESAWTNYAIGGAMVILASVSMLAIGARKEVKLTK